MISCYQTWFNLCTINIDTTISQLSRNHMNKLVFISEETIERERSNSGFYNTLLSIYYKTAATLELFYVFKLQRIYLARLSVKFILTNYNK